MHHSPLFKGMLTLPQEELPSPATDLRDWIAKAREQGLEGYKDETAVVLPEQLKTAELDEFILFLFLHAGENPPSVKRACAILKVSHFFAVDWGRVRTLGFDYHIREWIINAFDQLMGKPIGSKILENLQGYPVGHMGPDCRRRTIEGLVGTADKRSIFLKEEELIDEEIFALMREEGVA
ncbi:hypothetical protein R3P38DRAFT_3229012 [Favolaschia claudopus]|uniref:Uncharacterized protein n=1 Tax=Favolaschia claudopus TaxID=2862362 RepID=A0AAV9ZQR4_9AGAR